MTRSKAEVLHEGNMRKGLAAADTAVGGLISCLSCVVIVGQLSAISCTGLISNYLESRILIQQSRPFPYMLFVAQCLDVVLVCCTVATLLVDCWFSNIPDGVIFGGFLHLIFNLAEGCYYCSCNLRVVTGNAVTPIPAWKSRDNWKHERVKRGILLRRRSLLWIKHMQLILWACKDREGSPECL